MSGKRFNPYADGTEGFSMELPPDLEAMISGVKQRSDGSLGETAEPAKPAKPDSIKLNFFDEFTTEAAPKPWLIKNVMARGEISSWIAPPGGGKSTLLTDIAVHLGGAPAWRGYRIKKQAGSVIFALERANLTKLRLTAYRRRDGLSGLPIAVAGQIVDLMNKTCVDLIVDAIKQAEDRFNVQAGLAIFDTWSKGIAAGGGDENQAKDQNIALANLRRVIDRLPIHIASIGHTGKDEKKGQRGSNAKQADDDVEIQISGDTVRTVTVTKANDQPEGALTSFQLEPYEFGLDEDGDEFRTFVISKEIVTGATTDHNLSDRQQLAMEALTETLLASGQPAPPAFGLRSDTKAVSEAEWMDELIRQGVLDRSTKNPRARYTELRNALKRRKLIGVRDDLVWK